MNNYFAQQGWVKITKVEIEFFYQPGTDVVDFGLVWVIADKTVFGRSIKKGETEEAVKAYYEKRGYTDEDCDFFGTL